MEHRRTRLDRIDTHGTLIARAARLTQGLVLIAAGLLAASAIAKLAMDMGVVSLRATCLGWQMLAVFALSVHTPLRAIAEYHEERRHSRHLARTRDGMPRGMGRFLFEAGARESLRWRRLHAVAGAMLTPLRWMGVYVAVEAMVAGNLPGAVLRTKFTLVLLAVECVVRELSAARQHTPKKSLGESGPQIEAFAE